MAEMNGHEPRDQYGGWTGLKFEATGFFRIEHADRWWFVTPEGNAYLSLGLNHVEPDMMHYPYNARYWAKELGLGKETNLEAYLPGYQAKVLADMQHLGMSALGGHSPQWPYAKSILPYVYELRFADVCHFMTPSESDFWDVFAPEFEAHCDRMARERVLSRRQDPYLMGYYMVDGPILTELDAAERPDCIYGKIRPQLPTWPRVLRNKPAACPGKQAYVDTMREIYRDDISAFNRTYDTPFASFHVLLLAEQWRTYFDLDNALEMRDNATFLTKVLDRRYQIETAAIRRYDPNHMIFGDKMNCNTDTTNDQLRIASKYFDLLFLQFYGLWQEQEQLMDRFTSASDLPFLQGDAAISVPDQEMPSPFGPHCPDQTGRARETDRALRQALARDDFLGWHWCGWMDRWRQVQPNKQHSGLQDPFGNWYPVADTLAQISHDLYAIALAKD